MSKKTKINLAAALQEASGKQSNVVEYKKDDKKKPEIETSGNKMPLPPSRKGKKVISSYFDPAVSQQLKHLAIDRDTTIQALLTEALNDLFEKYNLKPFAR